MVGEPLCKPSHAGAPKNVLAFFDNIFCNNSNFLENVKRRDIDQKPSPKSSSIVCFLLFFKFLGQYCRFR